MSELRVALLTNFIAPYRLPLFRALAREVGRLRIFVSTAMESNRGWTAEWEGLDVVVQRSISVTQRWRTPEFEEPHQLHVPYDTLAQLHGWRPEVVLTGEMGVRTILSTAYARARRIPVAVWATLADHIETRRAYRHFLRRRLLRYVDSVIVNGESGARYVVGLGFPAESIHRMPYTTDAAAFAAVPLERRAGPERRLLFVGSLSERKGLEALVEALRRWGSLHPERPVALTVVGVGPMAAGLRVARLPPTVRLHLAGDVAYADLPRYYAEAELVVFPTLADEWGVIVNEALASGAPVIGSTRSEAVNELIEDGVNGWRFSPDGADAVVAVLKRALAVEAPTLARMRAAARSRGLALDAAEEAARLASHLRELAGRGR